MKMMTNQQILSNRFKEIDKFLREYLKNYKNVNKTTKDKIQGIFDSIKISYSDINKPVPKALKDRLIRMLLKWQEQGLFTNVFGYEANKILNRKNISYSDMINILIMGTYVEQNNSLDEYNNLLFYQVSETSYNQALDEIKPDKRPIFKLPILYTILNIPILNATAEEYLYALALTNANELYLQTLVNIQQVRPLNIDNAFFNQLMLKQQNRYVNINDDRLSGGIENIVEAISSESMLQAGIDTDTEQCRFIAEIDKRTTIMCQTLNNQLFYLDKMNVYDRYSAIDDRNIIYHTEGLVQGENLPPINNHFHYCRSTITYQIDREREEIDEILFKPYKDITNSFRKKVIESKSKAEERDWFKINGKVYRIGKSNPDGIRLRKNTDPNVKPIAEWLQIELGGKVFINPEPISAPFKTADFMYRNQKWELKTPKSNGEYVLSNSINSGKGQANNFIVDFSNSKLTYEEILNQVENAFNKEYISWFKKLIIKKDDRYSVFIRD